MDFSADDEIVKIQILINVILSSKIHKTGVFY